MRTALLLFVLFWATTLKAQDSTASSMQASAAKTYKVNPGERVSDALLQNGLYQYPQFMQAEVTYRNGTAGNGRLNYNRLTGEMQFVAVNGDTLTLSNEQEIQHISIGSDTFFYHLGYLQLVDNFSAILAKQTLLEITNRQRKGAFGDVNQAAISTHTAVHTSQGLKDIVPQEILTFHEKTLYFIGDRFGRFKPLNKKNLLSFYSKKEKEVAAYLRDHPVSFVQEEDVLRLINYLKTL